MLVTSPRLHNKLSLPQSMLVGDAVVKFTSSVKNLGVTLDSHLTMSEHVHNVCRAAYIQVRQISSIRHLLSAQATQTLVLLLSYLGLTIVIVFFLSASNISLKN